MDSQWLKTQFQYNPRKSKAGLARYLNMEPPAISKILAGTRQIKAKEYIKMRQFFGLPAEETRQRVKKANKDNYRMQEQPVNNDDWGMPPTIGKQRELSKNIRLYEVSESAMEPQFKNGHHVIIDIDDNKADPAGIFLVSDGYETFIRHCSYPEKNENSQICISAVHEDFEEQTLEANLIRLLGRVIGTMDWSS